MTKANTSQLAARAIAVLACGALTALPTASVAQPAAPTALSNSAAPDGSPALPKETTITQKSAVVAAGSDSVIRGEERVQGRLASARVGSSAASSYLIIDPNAGQTDRAASNAGKRVVPSQWEVFRF